jgi:hypothetical protein
MAMCLFISPGNYLGQPKDWDEVIIPLAGQGMSRKMIASFSQRAKNRYFMFLMNTMTFPREIRMRICRIVYDEPPGIIKEHDLRLSLECLRDDEHREELYF